MEAYRKNDSHFATKAIHVGQDPEQWTSMSVVPPIVLSSTFKLENPTNFDPFLYGRLGNPTRKVLETCLAALDGAKHAMAFASGMAACSTMIHALSAGDHMIVMDDVYGGSNSLLRNIVQPKMKIETTFVDLTEPKRLLDAIQPNTKMVWIETPTNPTMKLVDIKAVSDLAHEANREIIVVVDNTFESAYFQRPLELGADVTHYSLTKYMNGHTDVIMGSLSTNSDELAKKIHFLQYSIGSVPSPFDCFLVNRSLKTLKLRMKQHQKNSLEVAKFLESHPFVATVRHPGLPSHPQYELAKKQMYGHSGIFSFYHKGGLEESRRFLQELKMITLAVSLGGYESLAEIPFQMTHGPVGEEEKYTLGVTENLIRVSIGLEEVNDIIEDLDQALRAAFEF